MTPTSSAMPSWRSLPGKSSASDKRSMSRNAGGSLRAATNGKGDAELVATAPARGVLGLLAMSGPGRRAEAEETDAQATPAAMQPSGRGKPGAVETMLDQTVLLLCPAAAETALVRGSTLLAARSAATAAGGTERSLLLPRPARSQGLAKRERWQRRGSQDCWTALLRD